MTKFSQQQIVEACLKYGPLLTVDGITDQDGNQLDPVLVMWAFALNESFHEPKDKLPPDFFVCPPRFEPAYFSGRYSHESWQAKLNQQFGEDGAKSYGPWQVMLCNAGTHAPADFVDLEVCAVAFVGYMNRMIKAQKPKTLYQIADAFNSGNFRDSAVPTAYITKLLKHYYTAMPVEATDPGGEITT